MPRQVAGWRKRLESGAEGILHRRLSVDEIGGFTTYLDLLRAWQRTHRLVGSVEPGWVVDNLFLDSLLFGTLLPDSAQTVLDLGAGAGFPGLPLKIVRRDMALTMIEAHQRRVSFLRAVVRELRLTGVEIAGQRAESLLESLQERFDAVIMRCAGKAAHMVGLAIKFAVPGGIVILAGGPEATAIPGVEWMLVQPPLRPARRLGVYRVPRL